MAKITEKKLTETARATAALTDQFEALTTIANIENEKTVKPAEEFSVTKGRKDKLVTFNLSAEDYDKYKKWFGSKGMSFSLGLRMCLDYINYQDGVGKIVLTKSGVRENNIFKLE